ncbi:hypothetical protein GCM10027073_17570 [Streptomyces chlorus]|uniref:ATP-binding protein n=1 Tax=Streptomyces chlorus TaxID=887452 RepID=A0ABW1E234_9ACTN
MHDVGHRLDSWGHPYDSDVNETLTLITAELCANAIQHGRVPVRDFHVRLTTEASHERLRLEVSDTRAERRPAVTAPTDPDAESESGRGRLRALSGVHRETCRSGGLVCVGFEMLVLVVGG